METTKTLEQVLCRFEVLHTESLRGILRRILIFMTLIFGTIFSVWLAIAMLAGLGSQAAAWVGVGVFAGLVYFVAPYLSADCELCFTAAQVSTLDRGRRRRFMLESLSDARYHRKSLYIRIDGVPHRMFRDISAEDAHTLIMVIDQHSKHYAERMRAAGHDLETSAAPPPELLNLTRRSSRIKDGSV
jgi:hypothetical protein